MDRGVGGVSPPLPFPLEVVVAPMDNGQGGPPPTAFPFGGGRTLSPPRGGSGGGGGVSGFPLPSSRRGKRAVGVLSSPTSPLIVADRKRDSSKFVLRGLRLNMDGGGMEEEQEKLGGDDRLNRLARWGSRVFS